jgi:two-component system nitrate/nitrite response regulator NarL
LASWGRASGPILIADADPAFVGAVQSLLERVGYQVLVAATGDAALEVARQEKPPVVLLDVQLPVVNGYEVCRALIDEFGVRMAVAFVSGTRTEAVDISAGLLVGAEDYIVKPFDSSELLARVGRLARRVASDESEASSSPARLTGREREILRLLASGCTQADIARRLSISPKTVGGHIEHILGKLGVHSRAQAVAAAYREELIDRPR